MTELPDLVLVGAGHAHLIVLEQAAGRAQASKARLTVIVPSRHHAYSGMVPGVLAGTYTAAEALIDLARLADRAGAELIVGEAESIDRSRREVVLTGGRRVPYDVVSLAVGSVPVPPPAGLAERTLSVRPIAAALEILPALERATAAGPVRVVVAGGGAAGTEVAFALAARVRALPAGGTVALVERDRVLGERGTAASALAKRLLRARGVDVREGAGVAGGDGSRVAIDGGGTMPADLVVWAVGVIPGALPARTGLPLDERGFLLVEPTLRSVGDPRIFAAGDAGSIAGAPWVPKAGVYAVREGRVLARNLGALCGALARGEEPRSASLAAYRPQRRFLALLNTADGRAILSYGRFALHARWAMWLKDRIDRRWVRRF